MATKTALRWRLAEQTSDTSLFPGLFERQFGAGEFRGLEFLHVQAKSLINHVPKASGLPFEFTINTYRGCSHACTYCFARPTHSYLNLNPEDDFEKRIVVKINAVEVLRRELSRASWSFDPIALGTNTDPYQRCEGKYKLTRGVIETLLEFSNPYSVLTKSTLLLRDLNILSESAQRGLVHCNFSIGTLDPEVWRLTEPGTPHPLKRIEAVSRLSDAGIPTGVLIAPILPGLSDSPSQIEAVTQTALNAGATAISPIFLHLRPGVREVFLSWLKQSRPDLLPLYERLYRNRSYQRSRDMRVCQIVDDVMKRNGILPKGSPIARGRRLPMREPPFKTKSEQPLQQSLPGLI